jgi:hypothetical protein
VASRKYSARVALVRLEIAEPLMNANTPANMHMEYCILVHVQACTKCDGTRVDTQKWKTVSSGTESVSCLYIDFVILWLFAY